MRRSTIIRLAPALGALSLLASVHAAAAPSSSIRVPAGAQITVKGSTASLMSNGATGSYNCSCAADKGSCSIKQSPGVLECASSTASPCSKCEMDTTTNPKRSSAARSAVMGGGGAAPVRAP